MWIVTEGPFEFITVIIKQSLDMISMNGIRITCDVKLVTDDWKIEGASGKESLLGVVTEFVAGKWSDSQIEEFVKRNLPTACLSAQELEDVLALGQEELLEAAAKELRIVSGKGAASELAEICLYGVLREHFNCFPMASKIFYKQNSHDPAKGADSVHVRKETDGTLTYWYGEAKFFTNFGSVEIDQVVSSVEELFMPEKMKKENRLIVNYRDLEKNLDDETLYRKAKEMLRGGLTDGFMKVLHVPIMVIFQGKPQSEGADESAFFEEIKNLQLEKAKKYFPKHIERLNKVLGGDYISVCFHLILFPIKEKKLLASWFNTQMSILAK